ncbi:type II secretion system minor pseudopilin GspK [Aquisalimonas sp.]|uniref:type II secretion system minor pseudopilin GspK n=1 Tax=Aquisalimonas sp. TaxID=1872621 RepID=UPI0025C2189A|nr:type II secretion system minor pseudopilin GspK [Aquisalimonas sp.]
MSGAHHRQRGVALITALLAVAIVTILAVELTTRQHLDIRRTQNLLARDQAYTYALGVERWALSMLMEDRRQNDDGVDHLNEFWAQELTPPPFEGATMRLRMQDLQGRFNLNNLVTGPGEDAEEAMAQLTGLLRGLDVEAAFVQAAADWIDVAPDIRFPDGAGDDVYSRLDPPYRTANRPMISASELRLVRGVEDSDWRAVAAFVTALPERTPINVNTAPPEVLRGLAPGLSMDAAESLAAGRPDDGWQSVDDFLAQSALAGREIDAAGLSVGSNYFLLQSEIELGRVTIRSESVLYRPSEHGGQVILRRQGFFP